MIVRLSNIKSKTAKKCLFGVFRPFLSLCRTASWPCPLHQSIPLTQEPIHEILVEIAQLLAMLKNSVFLSRPFWIFFLLHPHENKSQIMCENGWDSIFNIMMVYSQKWVREWYNCMSIYLVLYLIWIVFLNTSFYKVHAKH